jgi:hypothetical protein
MSLAHIARDYCCVLLSLNAVVVGAESPNRDPSLEVACPAHFFLDQFTPVIYISYLLRRPDRTRVMQRCAFHAHDWGLKQTHDELAS